MKYWDGLLRIQEPQLSDIHHPSIYKDETGEVFLEINPYGIPVIHCYIYKWSKESYKHQKEVFASIMKALKNKGYDVIYAPAIDEKLIRFAKMFGFELTDEEAPLSDGRIRRVMKCQKQ